MVGIRFDIVEVRCEKIDGINQRFIATVYRFRYRIFNGKRRM